MKIKKPVLVVGMGISLLVGFPGVLGHFLTGAQDWAILSVVIAGSGLWFSKKYLKPAIPAKLSPIVIGKMEVVEKISETQKLLKTLEAEVSREVLFTLEERLNKLVFSLDRSVVQAVLTGGQKVGKSSLKNVLELSKINQQIDWLETDSLLKETTIDQEVIKYLSLKADLILFLITGDLTESEWAIIQQLLEKQVPLVLVFNKQDQYLLEERVLILNKLNERLVNVISPSDILSISAVSVPIVVRKIQPDGSIQERIDYLPEEIKPLEIRLKQRLIEERQKLICSNTWRQVTQLKQEAREQLNQVRKERALPIIIKYQWLVGLAVFANPLPVVDCLVNATFSTQMIVEINDIYKQKLLPKHIKIILVTLSELIVKLGLVELTTQSMLNLLKTNSVTYLAGATIQAVSAAYWTNIAGLSVIEYLQEQTEPLSAESPLDLKRLKDKFQQIWSRSQQKEILSNFLKQGLSRIPSGVV